jgi:riboflavin synthase
MRMGVECAGWAHHIEVGDSVCVNGCCLTALAVANGGGHLEFDVVPQTLSLTTLGALQPGEPVNLETAMLAATPMGGHIVQGHVDGVGWVVGVDTSSGGWRTRIEAPASVTPLLSERGSIAVDGVSLTVAAIGAGWFEVALIPATLDRTTLRSKIAGARVNVEADCMARMVAEQVRRYMDNVRGG